MMRNEAEFSFATKCHLRNRFYTLHVFWFLKKVCKGLNSTSGHRQNMQNHANVIKVGPLIR